MRKFALQKTGSRITAFRDLRCASRVFARQTDWRVNCATIGPKNSVFGGNQTTNDTIVRLGDAIKLIGR
jgi:hypothetical protein